MRSLAVVFLLLALCFVPSVANKFVLTTTTPLSLSHAHPHTPRATTRYVKKILQQMEGLWIRLDALSKEMPPTVGEATWAHCYEQVLLETMEGFAAVRKCNPAGRGMMKMDLTAIVRGIKKIHPVSTAPSATGGASASANNNASSGIMPPGNVVVVVCATQESIDAYLNAFYFHSRADLLQWVRDNRTKYYKRWMIGLAMVGVGAKMNMHEKDKLTKEISAMYA